MEEYNICSNQAKDADISSEVKSSSSNTVQNHRTPRMTGAQAGLLDLSAHKCVQTRLRRILPFHLGLQKCGEQLPSIFLEESVPVQRVNKG